MAVLIDNHVAKEFIEPFEIVQAALVLRVVLLIFDVIFYYRNRQLGEETE